jgi:hypothetical protein
MPIPAFTEYGLLPEGTFPATREDISDRYLGNPNRYLIWNKFELFLLELKAQPWQSMVKTLLLDGGFTSDKVLTKDIDVVADLSDADDQSAFKAICWFSAEKERLMRDYALDIYPYHPKLGNDLRKFFEYVKLEDSMQRNAPRDTRKGLLSFQL